VPGKVGISRGTLAPGGKAGGKAFVTLLNRFVTELNRLVNPAVTLLPVKIFVRPRFVGGGGFPKAGFCGKSGGFWFTCACDGKAAKTLAPASTVKNVSRVFMGLAEHWAYP
jgi:hypothetical protein